MTTRPLRSSLAAGAPSPEPTLIARLSPSKRRAPFDAGAGRIRSLCRRDPNTESAEKINLASRVPAPDWTLIEDVKTFPRVRVKLGPFAAALACGVHASRCLDQESDCSQEMAHFNPPQLSMRCRCAAADWLSRSPRARGLTSVSNTCSVLATHTVAFPPDGGGTPQQRKLASSWSGRCDWSGATRPPLIGIHKIPPAVPK